MVSSLHNTESRPGLVSVKMPAYNAEQYIGQAIESVLAQTYPHWELIVVDDGSTDHTADIVASFDDPRIRYTYQENRGQAAALNRGLDLARGDYVTTLDADDWFTSNSLAERVAYLEQHPEFGAVYGDGYYCDSSGEPLLHFSDRCQQNVVGDVYDTLIVASMFGTGAAVMIRRHPLEKYQLRYDESIIWCQDWDFYVRVAEKITFGYVGIITVRYRLHENNMTVVVPMGRRQDALIRTRFKVLASPRFAQVPLQQRSQFFYNLLLKNLQGRVADQRALIDGPQFRELPEHEQARLMRLTVMEYLLRREQPQVVKEWLRVAWSLAPGDIKTGLLVILSTINLNLARLAAKVWRSNRQSDQMTSPFALAKS